MKQICDLHTHSTFSDGTYTPTEIINEAISIGLYAVALCDHNTVDGLTEFLSAAKGKRIKAIPGAEFSVTYNGKELHLLALNIPEHQFDKVSKLMEEVNERKRQSNKCLVISLNQAGYEIDYESIEKTTPNGKFNRAHIAEELTKKGYAESIKKAFDTLLKPEHGYYKEPERISAFEMISYIKGINAIPVLAHPFLNLNYKELEKFLPLAKEKGLVGMECFYSTYDVETTQKSIQIADKFGLMYSGGSDFHGDKKPDIKMGVGLGNLKVPYLWLL